MTSRRDFLTGGSAAAIGLTALSAFGQQPNVDVPDPGRVARTPGRGPSYRACIIGWTGRGDYGHGMHLVFKHRRDVTVVGLSDPDARGRERAAREAGPQKLYTDYTEMLQKEKPDLVSIGPRSTMDHLPMMMACAEIGAHVYIEKPLAINMKQADQMVQAFEKRNLKCAVAHQMRIAPVIRELKAQLDKGLIGTVLEYRGRGKEDARSGGEDLIVLGSHVMDLMRWFAGAEPVWCSARITQDGRDITRADARPATEQIGMVAGDTVHATYAFPGEVMSYFASQRNKEKGGNRFGLDIYGTQGVASIELGGNLNVRVLKEPSWRFGPNKKWEALPGFENPNDPRRGAEYLNALAIDDLIESIQRNRRPFLSLQDTHASLEMTLAPFAAALDGGRVKLPLKVRTHPLVPEGRE